MHGRYSSWAVDGSDSTVLEYVLAALNKLAGPRRDTEFMTVEASAFDCPLLSRYRRRFKLAILKPYTPYAEQSPRVRDFVQTSSSPSSSTRATRSTLHCAMPPTRCWTANGQHGHARQPSTSSSQHLDIANHLQDLDKNLTIVL